MSDSRQVVHANKYNGRSCRDCLLDKIFMVPNSIRIVLQIIMLAILVVYLILYYSGSTIPYIKSEKSAVIGLLVLAFGMCVVAICVQLPYITWSNPHIIFAAIVGAVMLGILVSYIFNIDIGLLNNYKFVFNICVAMIFLKIASTCVHQFNLL